VAPATRTYDGSETDYYECARGHRVGIQWRELPTKELWPSEEIATAAYYRWLSRGGPQGEPTADWLSAEAEILRAKRWGGPEDGRIDGVPPSRAQASEGERGKG